ncbi:MAG: hypothetical protein ABL879_04230 [Devosia sp.]
MLIPVFFAAVFCWFMAFRAAASLSRLTPGVSAFQTFQRLGRWDFETIRAAAGTAAEPHILTYKRSFAGFFVLILVVLAFTVLAIVLGGNTPATLNPPSSSAASP